MREAQKGNPPGLSSQAGLKKMKRDCIGTSKMTQNRCTNKPENSLRARIRELENEVQFLRAVLQAINRNLHDCLATAEMRALIIKILKRKP
jgi:hypothetical protein